MSPHLGSAVAMEGVVKFTMDRAQATVYNQRRAQTRKVSVLARHHQGVSLFPSLFPPFSYAPCSHQVLACLRMRLQYCRCFPAHAAYFMQMHTVGWLVSTGGALSTMVAVRCQPPREAPATDGSNASPTPVPRCSNIGSWYRCALSFVQAHLLYYILFSTISKWYAIYS